MPKDKERVRHVPERTCVACRSRGQKRGLIRLVRTPDGQVEVDPTGRKAGRGAYLCPDPACWEAALKKKALNRALRVVLTPEEVRGLQEYASTLAPQDEEPDGTTRAQENEQDPGRTVGVERKKSRSREKPD